ncbi:YkvA family protein [Jeotgalibacillus campisalis]|uniref:DUF1232 domain-containing protein n=1 Tax=Jeotgalibacillus campisalis TaxID=220754 RepID=A0A0C2VVA2_9BACL|nr:DUF1232 domain-containing protein [Jeotgalibacillus campisalis]KIL47908.1 hypothetical protein KR50_20750 [Jeotgalibacillus campisalis]
MIKFWSRLRFIFTFRKSLPFAKEYFTSREVTISKKILPIFIIMVYSIFPMDFIPDYLILFGVLDDTAVAAFIFQLMVKMAPPHLAAKYSLLTDK